MNSNPTEIVISNNPELSVSRPVVCGDSVVNGAEECDPPGSNQTCTIGGYDGNETCASDCTWGSCLTIESCGDNVVNGNEVCDDGNLIDGDGCSSTCQLEEFCGDNIINGNEVCDGNDLGGANCATEGFDGGALTCNAQCGFDTSQCQNTGSGGCFLAGTQISMADGTSKNIEDVVEGDLVSAYDFETGETVSGKVNKTLVHDVSEYLIIDGLEITPEHPLWVNGEWTLAGDVKVGDKILLDDGTEMSVENVEEIEKEVEVYNFEVEKYHNYIANGRVGHNQNVRKPKVVALEKGSLLSPP